MQSNLTFLAIVPARGGSKGLPGKNIADLAGKPLIAWSIEAGQKSKYINKVVVSSDSDEILEIAQDFGAQPLKRPDKLASDTAASEPVIAHALVSLLQAGERYDYIVLLQPTSPLRNFEDIDNAIETMLRQKADALISVYEPPHTPYKAFKQNTQGYLEGLIDSETPFKRRQDLPKVYMPNGAIYIVNSEKFMKTGKLFTDKTIPYVMSIQRSADIDTLEDLQKIRETFSKAAML